MGNAVGIEILREGIALRKKGNVERALKKFDEVLRLNSRSAAAHREKAITLQIMGEKDQAVHEYKKALEIDPAYRMKKVGTAKKGEKAEGIISHKVSDVMATDIVSVPWGATLKDVATIMLRKTISSVAVRVEGTILGIVTERDFIRNYHLISGKDYAKIPVKNIMAFPLITIPADTSFEEAAKQMGKQGVRHLLVNDGDDIVGLISLRDLLAAHPKLIKKYMK
ncbi:MAG: CBS domain-containing protein [Candidatus Hydrothermarchaeaceae archaeon]